MALRRNQNYARYALCVQYHGAPFIGFKFQPEVDVDEEVPVGVVGRPKMRSVEFWLKKAVESILGVHHKRREEGERGDNENDVPYENLVVSSRTDRGVHALHNTLHIDMKPPKKSSTSGQLWRPLELVNGLNFHLKRQTITATTTMMGPGGTTAEARPVVVSDYLRVLNARVAPDCMPNIFHDESDPLSRPTQDWNARFSATERTYMYRVLTCPLDHDVTDSNHGTADAGTAAAFVSRSWAGPFECDRSWRVRSELDVPRMRAAASRLTGTRDFSSLRSAGCTRQSPVVTIHDIEIHRQPWSIGPLSLCQFQTTTTATATQQHHNTTSLFQEPKNHNEILTIVVRGNAFLYDQVRNLVGLLVAVGQGKIAADSVPEILEARNRSQLHCTAAPACGLFLARVRHGDFVI